MGRLIDADELTKVMTEDWFLNILLGTNSREAMRKALRDCIDSVPLAYDVEKVVAELEKREYNSRFNGECAPEAYMEAIDIVREGGVENVL